jgi:lipopolysaccharide export system protein LptA
MKNRQPLLLPLALSALFWCPAYAEKADREKPMNVEADALRYDDLKQTSLFTGNVVITKGTIIIRGARIDVRQDPEGYQHGLATAAPGQLAYYRQKREGADEFIEGEAQSIEYDGKADVVKFIRSAVLRRYKGATMNDETTGNQINYDNNTDIFTVDGGAASASPGNPLGRIRALLTPKDAAAAVPAPAPSAALRPSRSIDGDKR